MNRGRFTSARASLVLGVMLLGVMLLGAILLGACSGGASGSAPDAGDYEGNVLTVPMVLSDTVNAVAFEQGSRHVTLGELQADHPVMVLYFGYTQCADICPTTMADMGAALRQLDPAQQRQVQVVFVTVDPERDTAAVMDTWLAHFDFDVALPFVALRASVADTDAVGTAVGVPLSPPQVLPDGTVDVEHGAMTLVFVGGKASLVWMEDSTTATFVHDLTRVLDSLPAKST